MNRYAILDYDGFICKAFYAAIARDDLDSAGQILDDLTDTAIAKAISYFSDDNIKIILAVSSHSWKRDSFEDYKASRKKNEFLSIFRDTVIDNTNDIIKIKGLEADEIIAILSKYLYENHEDFIVFSDDKDLHYITNRYCKVNIEQEIQEYDELIHNEFYAQLLAGDSEDDIKGIPKVGIKTGMKLLSERGGFNLDNVISIYRDKGLSKYDCYKNIMLVNPLILGYNNTHKELARLILDKSDISEDALDDVIDAEYTNLMSNMYKIYGEE